MIRSATLLCAFILITAFIGCDSAHSPEQPAGQYFVVQVANEQFTMFVTDPLTIQLAVANFEGRNQMHPTGRIMAGNGGFNQPWEWQFIPESIRMAEVSIEVCDGLPSYVNSHLNDFISVGYCPWSGQIIQIGR